MPTRADMLTTACPACGRTLRLAARYGFLAGAVRCRSCADPRRGRRGGRGSALAGFIVFVLIPGVFFWSLFLGGLRGRRERPIPRIAPPAAPYRMPRERERALPPWIQERDRPRPEPQEI